MSDTQIFCKAPNTINTTGDKAIVVTKSGMASNDTVTVSYNSTNYPTLQAGNAYSQCSTTAKIFRDTRDSQLYYVRKMADNKCWMVDNLKYANYGNLHTENGKHLTIDGTSTQSTANSDVAKYVDPGANSYCTGNSNMPGSTNTRCGLLYNWYAATNGTGTYAQSTNGTMVTGSICPTNFRLPTATSNGSTAASTGTSYNAADFPVLNASMNSGSLATGTTSSYPTGWQPSGAWGGAFSGNWFSGSGNQGSFGLYWSSSVYSATNALRLIFSSLSVSPGNSSDNKISGYAVRCVMDAPAPSIVSIYPTKGTISGGSTINVFGTNFISGLTNVRIGNYICNNVNVVSDTSTTLRK